MLFRHRLSPSGHLLDIRLPLSAHPLIRPFLPLIFDLVLVRVYPSEAAVLHPPAALGRRPLPAVVLLLLGAVQLIPMMVVQYPRRVLSGPVGRGTLRLQLVEEPVVSGVGAFRKGVLACLPIFEGLFTGVKV